MKPNKVFEYTRADEVAECWTGVSRDLNTALWNKIVPHQKPIPNLEDSGPADNVDHENLASHWDKLTEEEQVELNRLAGIRDEEYQIWKQEMDTKYGPKSDW
jgi:hypothetical protein